MLEMPEMDDASKLRVGPIATGLVLVLGVFSSGAANIEDIVPLAEKSAAPGPSITKEEEEIAHRVRSLGPQAIPYLLPLLKKDVKGEVRELASYILSDMEGLADEHLDALIESRRNGDVWIPLAIARVGTPEAIAFLAEEIEKARWNDTQLVTAFQILGERGIPPLVDLIRAGSLNYGSRAVVLNAFRRLGGKAESAVGPLTEFVSSKQGHESNVFCAVVALGVIGPKARAAVPAVLELAKDGSGSLTQAVDHSLAMMRAPEALPRLIQRLEEPVDYLVFQDIASFRENGKEAGPALLRCLRQNRFGRREWAARTLGYIGYVEATPDLTPLLQSSDWRVVYACVESLGRLRATDALGPLSEIAESYWHPAVHEAANKAVRAIRGTASYDSRVALFDYGSAGASDQDGSAGIARPDVNRFYAEQGDRLSRAQLKKIADMMEGNASGPAIGGKNIENHDEPDRWRVPNVGIKVDDGYLVGFDRGEFGGELVLVDLKGYRAVLLRDNVQGVHRMGSDIVVVTGLSHLGMSHGAVYKVSRGNDGTLGVAMRWVVLPDAPVVSGVRPNGNLFVACYKEKVEITPSGDMTTAKDRDR